MADTIKIPIEIITQETLAGIKKFSKEVTKNLKLIEKTASGTTKTIKQVNQATKDQTKIIQKTNKETETFTKTQKILSTVLAGLGLAVASQSEGFKDFSKQFIGVNSASKGLTSLLKITSKVLNEFTTLSSKATLAAFAFKKILEAFNIDIDKLIKFLQFLNQIIARFDGGLASLAQQYIDLASNGLVKVNELSEKQEKIFEILEKRVKILASGLAGLTGIFLAQSKSAVKIINSYTGLGLKALNLKGIFTGLFKSVTQVGKVSFALVKTALKLDSSALGLSSTLGSLSLILGGVAGFADIFDNKLARVIQRLTLLASVIAASLSGVIIFLILKVSELATKLGTSLANAATKATDTFIEFEKKTFVFERTLKGFNKAFGSSIGTVVSWNETIKKTSDNTGFTVKALRGAVTEIVATTSALGFNEDQQRKLLEVTTDYASFLGDDVVQTTIEFISALNGNAQSVQKYGVKLNQASLQQKLFSKGLNVKLNNLAENEKIQLRFNSLLEQYAPIAGNATAVTETLAGQQKVLNNNIENLSQSFGEGAAIIENNNLVAAAFNSILNNINENVFSATGFFTSLIGRLLQITGVIVTLTFKIFAITKLLQLLNIFLKSELFKTLLNTPLVLVNKSLAELIFGTGKAITSVGDLNIIISKLFSIIKNQAKTFILTFATGIKNIAKSIVSVLNPAIKKLLVRLWALATNPIALAIAALSALIYGVIKALQFIEKETGIFTDIWNALKESFLETASIFDPVINLFKSFGKLLSDIAKKAVGFFIFSIAKLLKGILKLINAVKNLSLINKVFASSTKKDQIGVLEKSILKLDEFTKKIKEGGFNIDNLARKAGRGVANTNKALKEIDLSPLLSLQKELENVGVSDLQQIKNERNARLKIIESALKSEGKALKIAKELEEKIELDFNEKLGEIRKKETEEEEAQAEKRLKFIEEYKKSFIDTGKQITSILGKVGQSASQAFRFAFGGEKQGILDEIGLNESKLEENFKAGIITEIQFDLEKESLDKQRQELEQNTTIAIGTGLLNGLTQGAKGAEQVITGLIKSGLDLIVPGLGQALGPLVEAFAQGPEATRKMVDEFVQAIPVLIENIILAIPAFIEAIADNVDIIIMALVDRLDDIIVALVRAMPRVATKFALALAIQVPLALVKSFPQMAADLAKQLAIKIPSEIVKGIVKAFKGIGGSLFKDLGKLIFQGFIAALTGGFNILGSLFKKIFGFDGGGRGPVEKFLGFDFPFIKFSSGGLVGGSAKTKGDSPLNDTIPALLSAGEIVVPRSAVSGGARGVIDFLMGMGIMPKGFFLGGLIEDFVSTLAGGLGSLIGGGVGFVSDLFNPFGGLIEQAENYLTRFTEYTLNPKKWIDILKSLSRIGAEIDLDDLFDNPLDVISNAVKGVLDFFQGSFKNLLKANSPFAQGGMIPAGFNNDTFNARLTSGEYVIDRGLTSRLNDYLAAQTPQAGSNNMSVEILSKILSTMQKGQTINTNVEFNGDSLANIILELNRSNARLA